MFIPRIVCLDCSVPLKVKKNGYIAEAMAQGISYYKIRGDSYECPSCKVAMFIPAQMAMAEHYESGYDNIKIDTRFYLED